MSARRKTVAIIALFCLALLPRVLSLNTFITWDEPMWAYRSIRFLTALREGEWASTFLVGHPGVITMWLGSLGITVERFLAGSAVAQDLAWVSALPQLDPRDFEALRRTARFLPAAKPLVALVTAAAVVGIFALGRRLFGTWPALFGVVLIALDPFLLAHSRVLHLDAILASFMTLSLLGLLVYLTRERARIYLLFSGVMAGLAILNKSPALFLVPFTGLLIFVDGLYRRDAISRIVRDLVTWIGVAVLTILFLWPALWVNPVDTVQGVLGKATGYAAEPKETSEFFAGRIVSNPGARFYPVALLFRIAPLTLLGLVAAIVALFSQTQVPSHRAGLRHSPSPDMRMAGAVGRPVGETRSDRLSNEVAPGSATAALTKDQVASLGILLVYAVLFGVFLTLSAKKFDRYLLPIFPALNLVAGIGLAYLMASGARAWPRARLPLIGLAVILLFQAGLVVVHHPYYLSYYNPLLGGSSRALEWLPVGWGEGLDHVAQYLNQQGGAENLTVASGGVPGLGPLFVGKTIPSTPAGLVTADYVVLYVSDWQTGAPLVSTFADEEPEHVVHLNGIDYARVYRNTSYKAPLDYLQSQSQPGDLILVSTPSLLARHYAGAIPIHVLAGDRTEEEIAHELNTLAAGHQRVWYVSYPDLSSTVQRLAGFQLTTHAYTIEERSFPTTTITGYLLPDQPDFQVLRPDEVSPPLNFAGKLTLQGFGLTRQPARWGRDVGVVVAWQASQKMADDYTVFIHLLDDEGRRWGQRDKPLLNDSREPTSAWEIGQETVERYALSPFAGIPPGRYHLQLGVYNSNSLDRLGILGENKEVTGTIYVLGRVEVASSPLTPTSEDLAIPHPMSHDLGGRLELLGYGLGRGVVRPGETLPLSLFWRALTGMQSDFRLHLTLHGPKDEVWASREFPLANIGYPTSQWRADEIIRGWYDLTIHTAAGGGEGQLRLNLVDARGQPLLTDDLFLTALQVEALERRFTIPEIQHPVNANLGDRISLLGYDLPATQVAPGESFPLTLYWQTKSPLETSYTVFVHLLDSENRIRGQRDSVPLAGTRPTTSWLTDEVLVDRYEIPVDSDTPPGEYSIEIGMYNPETLERLPAIVASEQLPEDRILLQSVQVDTR